MLSKKYCKRISHLSNPSILKEKRGYNFIAYGTESSFMKSFLTSNQTLKKILITGGADLLEATLPNSY